MDEREGGGERDQECPEPKTALPPIIGSVQPMYTQTTPLYSFVNDPFFSLCQIFEALEEDLSTFIHGVTSHVSDIT